MNLDRGGKLCMTCSPRALIAGLMSFFTRSAAPRAPRGASTLSPRHATEEALKPPDRLRALLPMPPREKKDRRGLWGIARQDECFLGSFVSKGFWGSMDPRKKDVIAFSSARSSSGKVEVGISPGAALPCRICLLFKTFLLPARGVLNPCPRQSSSLF